MQDFLSAVAQQFSTALMAPNLGTTEFFVAVLVACGLVMIALSSLLPRGKAENLEWWER
jgi:hypothetical protein